jgi:hypothetical protein
VQAYDTAIKSFPGMFYSKFKEKPYFTAAPGAETVPKVDFGAGGTGTNK